MRTFYKICLFFIALPATVLIVYMAFIAMLFGVTMITSLFPELFATSVKEALRTWWYVYALLVAPVAGLYALWLFWSVSKGYAKGPIEPDDADYVWRRYWIGFALSLIAVGPFSMEFLRNQDFESHLILSIAVFLVGMLGIGLWRDRKAAP